MVAVTAFTICTFMFKCSLVMFLQVYTLQDYGVTEDNVSSFPDGKLGSFLLSQCLP